ncbi:hypothetical protein Taro_033036 [Colocasia esculenta]|uniref:Uncharacterized protein n=1 Tax=Colocasia esculenta TaxID=4460 RepID=A0A843W7V5_COLES|nr:hypothetical protein [Colocasia esculenta]
MDQEAADYFGKGQEERGCTFSWESDKMVVASLLPERDVKSGAFLGQTILAKVLSTHLLLVSTQCFKAKAECCRNGEAVSTLDQVRSTPDAVVSTLEAVPRRPILRIVYSVSTLDDVVSTLETLPREAVLPVWDSVSTHPMGRSTHSQNSVT